MRSMRFMLWSTEQHLLQNWNKCTFWCVYHTCILLKTWIFNCFFLSYIEQALSEAFLHYPGFSLWQFPQITKKGLFEIPEFVLNMDKRNQVWICMKQVPFMRASFVTTKVLFRSRSSKQLSELIRATQKSHHGCNFHLGKGGESSSTVSLVIFSSEIQKINKVMAKKITIWLNLYFLPAIDLKGLLCLQRSATNLAHMVASKTIAIV